MVQLWFGFAWQLCSNTRFKSLFSIRWGARFRVDACPLLISASTIICRLGVFVLVWKACSSFFLPQHRSLIISALCDFCICLSRVCKSRQFYVLGIENFGILCDDLGTSFLSFLHRKPVTAKTSLVHLRLSSCGALCAGQACERGVHRSADAQTCDSH